ncbi:hypothetical protein [Senegalia massiliensis]|uniref:hypothetical protein n=1 Tax=Senegalia massiliensis TaxID=1720316 RepID=UPI0010301953|nr:hypothetical protein [Senegalia massiliensis]
MHIIISYQVIFKPIIVNRKRINKIIKVIIGVSSPVYGVDSFESFGSSGLESCDESTCDI